MLIFNRTEIENSFKENDNEIMQIESRLSFREFLQKLQNTYQLNHIQDLKIYGSYFCQLKDILEYQI